MGSLNFRRDGQVDAFSSFHQDIGDLMNIDWTTTPYFKPEEWPDGTLEHMDGKLFEELFKLRAVSKKPMTPSPLYSAHVREVGNSRHSTQNYTRLSDATDMFLYSWKDAYTVWLQAVSMDFGGIGLYVDTVLDGKPRPMIHLDMRPNRILWIRHNKNEYVYYHKDPQKFLEILSKAG
jgi:hypothetical protein